MDTIIFDQLLSCFSITWHDRKGPFGPVTFLHDLCKFEHGQWCHTCWLDDDRTPGRNRWCDLVSCQIHRKIKRTYARYDTCWKLVDDSMSSLAQSIHSQIITLTINSLSFTDRDLKGCHTSRDLKPCFIDRFSIFQAEKL